jgi:hypothetical protein
LTSAQLLGLGGGAVFDLIKTGIDIGSAAGW